MGDRIDLDLAESLSARVPRVGFIVDSSRNMGENWLVADFGCDDGDSRFNEPDPQTGRRQTVIVTTDRVRASQRASASAAAEADLVAWLLTHRDELIRLARVGQDSEVEVFGG